METNQPIYYIVMDNQKEDPVTIQKESPSQGVKYIPVFEAEAGPGAFEAKPSKRPETSSVAGVYEPSSSAGRAEEELTMEDLYESDVMRFRLENSGRSYTANPTADPYTDVLRRVFLSYPEEVQYGMAPPSPDHHSGVFQRDLDQADEESKRRSDEMNEEIRRRRQAYKERFGVYPKEF
jgi:hypothetical protein